MKDYIRDNGRIRNCPSNIAKMNVFEYVWFDLIHNKILKYAILDTLGQYKAMFKELFYALANTFMIIFFPLTLLIKAFTVIKGAKERIKMYEK